MNTDTLEDRLVESWWFVPSLVSVGLAALAVGLLAVDDRVEGLPGWLVYSGGPSATRQVLSTLASGLLSFTGLTFSITVVALVLASNQFSPRVLRTFLRDRRSQLTLGVFVGTYVFLIVILRAVRGEAAAVDVFVPRLSVTVAFALTILAVAFFVQFVHHIAHAVRASTIITRIGDETRELILATCPDPRVDPHDDETVSERQALDALDPAAAAITVRADTRGSVIAIDVDRVVELAEEHDVLIEIVPRIGDFVRSEAILARVYADRDLSDEAVRRLRTVRRSVGIARERSLVQDIGFGLRQLVDIAEKAQSPGINDPTTSVQAVDMIHDLLWHLGRRRLPNGVHRGPGGEVRVVRTAWTWDDYVHLAFDEARHWGADSIQMHRRLRQLLSDLRAELEGDDRRAALDHQAELLDARLHESLPRSETVAVTRTDPTSTTVDSKGPGER